MRQKWEKIFENEKRIKLSAVVREFRAKRDHVLEHEEMSKKLRHAMRKNNNAMKENERTVEKTQARNAKLAEENEQLRKDKQDLLKQLGSPAGLDLSTVAEFVKQLKPDAIAKMLKRKEKADLSEIVKLLLK